MMMKPHITCFLVLLLLAGCKGKAQEKYSLNGQLKGIDSGWVKLVSYNMEQRRQSTIDSAKIVKGKFEMAGKIAVPEMMTLQIEPGNWNFKVFIENQPIQIIADTTGAAYSDYRAYGGGKSAQIKSFTEIGSANFNAWKAYQDDPGQRQFELALEQLNKKFSAVGKDINAQYKVRAEADSVRGKQQAWQKKRIDQYVAQHPDAVAGIYMFDQVFRHSNQMPYKELDDMLNKFTGEAKASVYYKALDKSRAQLRTVEPGEMAPDFTLLQRDSTKLTLSSLRGRYVLIDFWASWCHPCRGAIPHWKLVFKKYHEKGLDIISLSDDNKWDKWTQAIDVEKMPWKQVIDEFPLKNMPARVSNLYMVTSIPHYVLLDKEGKILIYSKDKNEIDKKLTELFRG